MGDVRRDLGTAGAKQYIALQPVKNLAAIAEAEEAARLAILPSALRFDPFRKTAGWKGHLILGRMPAEREKPISGRR